MVGAAKMRLPFGGRVTGSANRAVLVIVKALPIVAGVDATNGDPLWLVIFDLVLPPVHPFLPIGSAMTQAGFQIAHLPREVGHQHLLFSRVGNHRRFMVVI